MVCLRVSFDKCHSIACLLPSLTTVYYYFVLILRVAATANLEDDGRLVDREMYTDYVIVSKETSLGIAGLDFKNIMHQLKSIAAIKNSVGHCA